MASSNNIENEKLYSIAWSENEFVVMKIILDDMFSKLFNPVGSNIPESTNKRFVKF